MAYKIYKITNRIDNRVYVGCTSKSLEQRFRWHRQKSINPILKLHKEMNLLGRDNFTVELIEEIQTKSEASIRESHWISIYNSDLNVAKGFGSKGLSLKGIKKCSSHAKNVALSKLGKPRPWTDKWIENMQIARQEKLCHKIKCNETGVEYASINDASRKTGIKLSNLVNHLNGKGKTCRGMTFHRIGGLNG